MIGYGVALIGGLLILFVGYKNDQLMPVFVILANGGICIIFVLVYAATALCFPTEFLGTAFGLCNLFARGMSIGAPEVSEVKAPYPMCIFCIMTAVGLVLTPFIKPK